MKVALLLMSAAFAAAAAVLWGVSALVKLPAGPANTLSIDLGGLSIGKNKMTEDVVAALRRQSRLSAAGAACAALAVLAQLPTIWML